MWEKEETRRAGFLHLATARMKVLHNLGAVVRKGVEEDPQADPIMPLRCCWRAKVEMWRRHVQMHI